MTSLEAIEHLPILANLATDRKREVAGSLEAVEFATGAIIIREGAEVSGAFVIVSGRVVVVGPGPALIAWSSPGLAEPALMDESYRSSTVRAESPVRAWHLPRGALASQIERHPSIALTLLANLARRLQETSPRFFGAVETGPLVDAEEVYSTPPRHRPAVAVPSGWKPLRSQPSALDDLPTTGSRVRSDGSALPQGEPQARTRAASPTRPSQPPRNAWIDAQTRRLIELVSGLQSLRGSTTRDAAGMGWQAWIVELGSLSKSYLAAAQAFDERKPKTGEAAQQAAGR